MVELPHSGHQGIVKIKELIRFRVWFPGIDKAVEDQVRECSLCQTNSLVQVFKPLKPSKITDSPWKNVDGDFYGPMEDEKYHFVNIEEYSRNVFVHSIRATDKYHVIIILNELFSLFGSREVYKTDNGPPFQSHGFTDFAKQMGFQHLRTTSL